MGATALIAGTVISAGSQVYGGIQKKRADDFAAAQVSQEAGQSTASGIQGAIEQRRRASYVASSARAHIAASGMATTGPSAITTVGGITGEGDYRALTALYQGEDRAQELRYKASGLRAEGSAAQTAGWMSGISSVLTGGYNVANEYPTFFDKYGASTT